MQLEVLMVMNTRCCPLGCKTQSSIAKMEDYVPSKR
jgi:hypothetical protein